ncbi:hypothetical protein [Nostoc sp.]|uniref:hypothetical protein n=1 Tax=Nostoc sp. TaxID=1180 RepID=UPI002FF7B035
MSNREFEEMQEKLANQKLASELGISYDDLLELEWDIDTNESDDGLIYEYIVTFSEESPKKILNKIEGIEDGNIVRLQPSSFEEPDDFE